VSAPAAVTAARGDAAEARAERRRACTILLVDDEAANLDLLEALLESEGYASLVRATDPRAVPALVERHAPDLVLLDLHMPHRHGLDVLRDLGERTPAGEYRPVLVLTADVTWEAKERALALGARDFVTKPFDAAEVLLRVANLLETRILHDEQRRARARAEEAEARQALLAEWSRLLASSLDPAASFAHLPRLVVPRWADACTVLLRTPDGAAPVAERFADERAAAAWGAPLRARAAAAWDGAARGPEPADADADGAVLVAPIAYDGAPVGAIAVARARPSPDAHADRVLLDEVAARAGLAAEHARLFAAAALATEERERLLAVVAHDLRNPLAVVAMYAETLAISHPDDGDPFTRRALGAIHENTAAIQRLVEDLLDASALRQGALRINREARRVGPVMEEAERLLRPLAVARGVTLAVHAPPGDADRVAALDGPRLVQLLSNLGGNAIKYTPPGGAVALRYAVAEGALAASVSDTGPGIAEEDLPHLFTAFWQREQRDGRGVGLGLWIARAIVEAHGGRMRVESCPGQGTTFHFTLAFETGTSV
jgi:signal transduction histidine kinase/CheY-like chemotaxis protein